MPKLKLGDPVTDTQPPPPLGALVLSEGELKVVTAVFVDVVGSLHLAQHRDDEQFLECLDPALELMVATATRYGGTVMRVQGDGVLALFGAPQAQEDHAVRACLAALHLRDAFASSAATHGPNAVQVRIGLHMGEAIVRTLRTAQTRDYDAVGKAVHIASRTEKLCPPGSILVTGEVIAATRGLFDARRFPAPQFKGTDQHYELFELVAQRSDRAGIDRFVHADAPLLGREEILASYDVLMTAVFGAAKPAVQRIEGEAGYGKTRLVHEIARRAEKRGFKVVVTKGVSHFSDVPYLSVRALVLRLLDLEDRAHTEEFERRIEDALARIAALQALDRIALLDMLGFARKDKAWDGLNPPERRARLRDALVALWRFAIGQAPCLLVMEDTHWMDQTSLEVLDRLVAGGHGGPLLAIATHRSTKRELPVGQVTRLGPLSLDDSCRLVELISAEADLPRAACEAIAKRSGGVPFYVHELVRERVAKLSSRDAPGVDRGQSPQPERGQSDIPLAIEASILARVDRLPKAAQTIAHTAAVMGSTCDRAILDRACQVAGVHIEPAIDALVGAKLIERQDTPEHKQILFTHEITRDVLLRTMVRSRRRGFHLAVLRAMEEAWGNATRDARQVHALAIHAEAAQQWREAVEYLTIACRQAVRNSSVREAVGLYDRAREAVSKLEGQDYRAKEVDLSLLVFQAYLTLGEISRLTETLAAAAKTARALGDELSVALATVQLATAQWMNGDQVAAVESARTVLEYAERAENLPLQFSAKFTLANALHCRGELDEAIGVHQQIIAALEDKGLEHGRLGWPGIPSVMSRAFLCWLLIERGRFEDARKQIERGCAVGDAVGQPYSQVLIHAGHGLYHLRRGYPGEAIPILHPALKLCQDAGVYTMEAIVAGWLGTALVKHGRAAEALAIAEDAYRRKTHLRGAYSTWFYLFKAVGEAHGALGNTKDALDWANQAIEVTQRSNEILHYAQGLKCRADLQLQQAPEAAIADLEQARKFAAQHGLVPLAAECDLSMAVACGRIGQDEAAQQYAREAAQQFRELGLERHLAEAERLVL
jgi:class 3 adenylate cyclase/tetratricopeptide (TPR) repeat protein